jgi:hypothetical protein
VLISSVRSGFAIAKKRKVEESSLLGLLTPIEDASQFSDESNQQQNKREHEAAENALNELEEAYSEMVNSIDIEKINLEENYVKGYITRSEKRRGGPYTKAQRNRFLQLAAQAKENDDKELIRILALELCIGISPKMEKAVLASFGNLFIHHRDAIGVLKDFTNRDENKADANLIAYIRTLMMLNQVEGWMGRIENVKHRFGQSFFGKLMTSSKN